MWSGQFVRTFFIMKSSIFVSEGLIGDTQTEKGISLEPAVDPQQHPWQHGQIFSSAGGHFTYRVIGPCCRLFDRDNLPWPCCRLEWRGKEPSWRRVGRRFVADLAVKTAPSYNVEILAPDHGLPFVMTLYWVKLSPAIREWWYARKNLQSKA